MVQGIYVMLSEKGPVQSESPGQLCTSKVYELLHPKRQLYRNHLQDVKYWSQETVLTLLHLILEVQLF